MLDLKTNLEEIEKVMKNVKNVTSCSKAEECYPRMKKLVHDNNKIKKNLIDRVDEKKSARNENKSSLVHQEALEHNLTEDEIQLNFNYLNLNNFTHPIKFLGAILKYLKLKVKSLNKKINKGNAKKI